MRVFCFFVFCAWSDQTDFMALFYAFNWWSVPCLIFESCSFFSSVPVTTRGLGLFLDAYLNKLSVSVVPRN